ncbi:hypothetical protein FIBSPDRAFT_890989 [Athelia psychrophila]|uniref:Uncharacterized protein n=1 Tax=Athelia psychrophila TaxID=1759441 RepID=A0A166KCV0_9AGAM|nr:hypothetical protein FIBSPDRAFT_890989 [Fibularhizoctonia sp. CBS 109695]
MTLYWLHRLTFPAATRPANRDEGSDRCEFGLAADMSIMSSVRHLRADHSRLLTRKHGGKVFDGRQQHGRSLAAPLVWVIWGLEDVEDKRTQKMMRLVYKAAGIMACTAAVFCAQRDARMARSRGERNDGE